MTVAEVILWALLHVVDPPELERARLEAFAADTTRAVDAATRLPFEGPAARDAAIAALLVTAHHESGLRPDVVECRARGDGGRSVTAWQLLGPFGRNGHTVDEVCDSVELAASAALHALSRHPRCTPGGMWRAYASGSCATKSTAAEDMCRAWVLATRKLGIEGANCDVRKPLTWRDPS